jgi:hypothetical protein
MYRVPLQVVPVFSYQARRSSDNVRVVWSSDGPDPNGTRAGVALVAGSISRLV